MLGIKVEKKQTQKAIGELKELGLLSGEAKVEKSGKYTLIPLKNKSSKVIKKLGKKYEVIEHSFQRKKQEKSFSELAKDIVPEELHPKLKTAFDIVGDIGILEIDKELREYEKELGKALLKSQNNLKTAVRKEGSHKTEFRIQKHKFLAGERKTTTLHKENNAVIELDINNMYFSPRLSTERKRISLLVKKGEDVLVMFSGAAPYVCIIGKNSQAKSITGIELNPKAHEYAEKNIKRNKIKNARLIKGDVRKAVDKIKKRFDRIIMPLPKGAEKFLPSALKVAKPNAAIHLYQFASPKEINALKTDIKQRIEKQGWKTLKISRIICGQQAPEVYRVCFDIEVAKKVKN
jgi:tRNA (guanine37-N1)-methyltransferase